MRRWRWRANSKWLCPMLVRGVQWVVDVIFPPVCVQRAFNARPIYSWERRTLSLGFGWLWGGDTAMNCHLRIFVRFQACASYRIASVLRSSGEKRSTCGAVHRAAKDRRLSVAHVGNCRLTAMLLNCTGCELSAFASKASRDIWSKTSATLRPRSGRNFDVPLLFYSALAAKFLLKRARYRGRIPDGRLLPRQRAVASSWQTRPLFKPRRCQKQSWKRRLKGPTTTSNCWAACAHDTRFVAQLPLSLLRTSRRLVTCRHFNTRARVHYL